MKKSYLFIAIGLLMSCTSSVWAVDWNTLSYIGCAGNASEYTKYKVSVPAGWNVVEIQIPFGTPPGAGIFINNLPSADITACSLGNENYTAQGASILLHMSAFTQRETEFTVTVGGTDYTLYVLNDNIADGGGGPSTTYTEPQTAAPIPPARNAGTVVSLYSDAYTAPTNWGYLQSWGQSSVKEDIKIGNDNILKYTSFNYVGWQGDAVDASNMEYLHVDIWVENDGSVCVYPIAGGSPADERHRKSLTLIGQKWNSFDIVLTDLEVQPGFEAEHSDHNLPLNSIIQFKLGDGVGNTAIFVDNVYFYTTAVPAITEAQISGSSKAYKDQVRENGYSWTISNDNAGNVNVSLTINDALLGLGAAYLQIPYPTFSEHAMVLTGNTCTTQLAGYQEGDEVTFHVKLAVMGGDVYTRHITYKVGFTPENVTATPEVVENVNFALTTDGATATASSVDGESYANKGINGNSGDRWGSVAADNQWYKIDLGQARIFNTIKIDWETAHTKTFDIYVALEDGAWGAAIVQVENEVLTGFGDSHLIKTYEFENVTARYIYLKAHQRGSQWGNSFWTFEAYKAGTPVLTHLAISAADVAKKGVGLPITIAATDQMNNPIETGTITWTVTDGKGSINAENQLVATQTGWISVTATAGGITSNTIDIYAVVGDNVSAGKTATDHESNAAITVLTDGEWGTGKAEWQGDKRSDMASDRTNTCGFDMDLGGEYDIELLTIRWEDACSDSYKIEFSTDGETYNEAYSVTDANYDIYGRSDFYYENGGAANVRNYRDLNNREKVHYIRFTSTKNSTNWGMKVYEMQVFGTEWIPSGDNTKPVMGDATLASVDYTSIVLNVIATDKDDNNNDTEVAKYVVVFAGATEQIVMADNGQITLTDLEMGKTYNVTIYAKDNANNVSENGTVVEIVTPFNTELNLALNRPVTANGNSGYEYREANVNNGNAEDGWASQVAEAQVTIDLEDAYNLSYVKIYWTLSEASKKYIIKGSLDNITWYDLTDLYTSAPTEVSIRYDMPTAMARYIRLESYERVNNISIYVKEIEVYGTSRYVSDGKPILITAKATDIKATTTKLTLAAIDTDTDAANLVYTVKLNDGEPISQEGNPVFALTGLTKETNYSFMATVSDGTNTSAEVTGFFITGDKWADYDWIPNNAGLPDTYTDKYKTDIQCSNNLTTMNIQQAGENKGIYITFTGEITEVLPTGIATTQGGGMWVNPDQLQLRETQFSVKYAPNGTCEFYIYKVDGVASLDAPTNVNATVVNTYITTAVLQVSATNADSYHVNGKSYTPDADGKIYVTGLADGVENTLTITAYNNTVPCTAEDVKTLAITTQKNLAKNKTTEESGHNAAFIAANAVDGNDGTEWESDYSGATDAEKNNQYLIVDLVDNVQSINTIEILWKNTCPAATFHLQVSNDKTTWTNITTESIAHSSFNGNLQVITFADRTARYIRFQGVTRQTAYGYGIYELRVNGILPELTFTDLTIMATGANTVELAATCTAVEHFEISLTNEESSYQPANKATNGNILFSGLNAAEANQTVYVKAVSGSQAITKSINVTTYQNYSLGGKTHASKGDDVAGNAINNDTVNGFWYNNSPATGDWWQIDFGGQYAIKGIELYWEAAYSKHYKILSSNNGYVWSLAKEVNETLNIPQGKKGAQIITFDDEVNAQFIRFVNVEARNNTWGIHLYEFRAFGEAGQTKGAASTTKVVYHDCAATHSAIATLDTDVPFVYARQVHELQWHTLYLPFEVTDVTFINPNDNKEYRIKPRLQAATEGEHIEGNYWLYHFGEDKTDLEGFKEIWVENASTETLPVKQIPYIMQFPNVSNHAFEGATVLFYGKNYAAGAGASTVADDHFAYTGNPTYETLPLTNADYVLDAAQGFFVAAPADAVLPAFECYLHSTAATVARMPRISWDGQSTEIVTDWVDSQLSTVNCQISANGITLMSDQPAAYAVYTITGQVVTAGNMQQGSLEINIPQGLYLIRLGNETFKVIR